MAGVSADEILRLNRLINQYDPPKDLQVGNILNLKEHRVDLTRMLHNLFGVPASDRWTPIGSRKEIIEEAINNGIQGWKSKGIKVVRMKHSSGNNPAPEGLYLAQDNGPSDVVSNPRFLITPASVLDPAGKTKKGPNIVNVISRYKTLPQSYINDIGMNNIITDGILMTDVKNNYRVTIPVTLEEENSVIVENFSKDSFVPQELNRVRPSYFAGNREKNAAIARMINNKQYNPFIEGEKYILCKELGDTLQVQWLNYIFEQDPNITRSNTVIGTTDEVVLWRSIVNKVGVIYTNSLGQTRRYLPVNLSPEEKRRINAQRVKNIRDDLFAHNTSVITLLHDIIMKGNKIVLVKRGTISWIENLTWNLQQLTNAVNFLSSTIIDLVKINNILFGKFTGDSDEDVENAKQLASKMRFTNPFVKYRTTDTYKIITSTNQIYPDYPFRARRFLPSSFNAAVLQIGGSYEEMIKIINNKVAKRLQNQNQNIDRIESILSKNSIIDTLFLFCFIREFFPELFTYADFMKVSFLNPPIYDNNIDFYDLKRAKQEYSWEYDVFKREGRIYYVSSIVEVLEYARLFIELFPDFRTEQLDFLFSNLPPDILPPVILPPIRDGELDYAATIAISLYEPYYLEELKSPTEMDSTEISFFVTTTLYDISEDDEDIFSYARKIYNEKTKNPRKRKANEDFTGNDEISEEFIENDESESEKEIEALEALGKERLESNIKRAEATSNNNTNNSFGSILPPPRSFNINMTPKRISRLISPPNTQNRRTTLRINNNTNESSISKELIGISEPSTKAASAEGSMNNTNDSNTSKFSKRRSAFTKIRKINTSKQRDEAANPSTQPRSRMNVAGGRRTRRKNKTRR